MKNKEKGFSIDELEERSRNPVSKKTENLKLRMDSTVSKVEKIKWLARYPVKVSDNYGKDFPEYLKEKRKAEREKKKAEEKEKLMAGTY